MQATAGQQLWGQVGKLGMPSENPKEGEGGQGADVTLQGSGQSRQGSEGPSLVPRCFLELQ